MRMRAEVELPTCDEVELIEIRLLMLQAIHDIDAELAKRKRTNEAVLNWALPKEWRTN